MTKYKVLIVDDSSSVRKIIEKILKDAGIKDSVSASDGDEALKILNSTVQENQKPFDLIISDWHMPKMSGLELLKNIRSHIVLKETIFLMVTSSTEQSDILVAIKEGVSDYVVKPFNTNLIQEKIFKSLKKIKKVNSAA
jgi:two-component system chemotaxis response regulator CheY